MGKSKHIQLYWKCQLLGWSLASLYWSYTGFTASYFNFPLTLVQFIGDVFIYILITHLYRLFSLKYNWHTLTPRPLLVRIIPAVFVLGWVYVVLTICKLYVVKSWMEPGFETTFSSFISRNWLLMFIAGVRLMSIWVLAYYLYHYAQREINTVKENARLTIIAKEAQINNLAAQLNPHFFFNSLNNIKALVVEKPETARRAIDLLSDLLRTSLYGRDKKLITVREEIEMINDYLELEKMRFENRLKAEISVDNDLADVAILPLSIQTLVENGIKHGIARLKEGGTICLKIEKDDQSIKITVQNPGKLVETTNDGLGLKNLRERLQLQYNGKAEFKLMEQSRGTVSAILIIPQA